MGDNKQLLLLGSVAPGDDNALLERLQGCIGHRNCHGPSTTKALNGIAGEQVKQIVVGPSHIALLFSDNTVGRLQFSIETVKSPAAQQSGEKPSSGGTGGGSNTGVNSGNTGNSSSISAVPVVPGSGGGSTGGADNGTGGSGGGGPGGGNGTGPNPGVVNTSAMITAAFSAGRAKVRRVMMSGRRTGMTARAGVIVDRNRPVIPASAIPEELIAQAQVVLQGKSREVIVRELQRTNLNVNEAVNNLLSREDDEDESAEAYLPEELLNLLDSGLRASDGLIDPEGIYAAPETYDYIVSRDIAVNRRRDGRDASGRKERSSQEQGSNVREKFAFGSQIDYWTGDKEHPFPPDVKGFTKIAALNGELLALTEDGKIYGWLWEDADIGDLEPHEINARFLGTSSGEHFVDIETSAYRAVVLTNNNRVGTFVDETSLGKKVSSLLFVPLVELPEGEVIKSIHACPMFAAVQTKSGIYWWGISPFNERRRVFDKQRSRAKKFQTNATADIKVGSEVRTKSNPVYSANSVAVNLQSSPPMIGIMMESAWSLTETCRFRIYTPEQYDQLREDDKDKEEKKAINHDASSGSSTAPPPVKETAWAIKDVFFIHEEPCNDIGVVQLIDGPICAIHFKSYIDEKKRSGGDPSTDVQKLRLIRKDELFVVQSSSKVPLAPITFEHTPQRLSLPSNVKKSLSMTVDNRGFQLLIEKRGQLHVVQISTLGKVISDNLIPVNASTVCGAPDALTPSLMNYGDENALFLRDCNGVIVPLVRNAINGFTDPNYLGLSGMTQLSVGVRYLKSGNELTTHVLSSAPCDSPVREQNPRNGTKVVLVATLIAPSPKRSLAHVPSLMQLVLYCDARGVKKALRQLASIIGTLSPDEKKKFIDEHILIPRADGNRTILHAAVMSAFAKRNADQADMEPAAAAAALSNSNSTDGLKLIVKQQQHESSAGASSSSPGDSAGAASSSAGSSDARPTSSKVEPMEVDDLSCRGQPVADVKLRQKNSIEILEAFMKDENVKKVMPELLHVRDIHGHTPFISAVHNRAYGAASIIWQEMRSVFGNMNVEDYTTNVYNPAVHTDDSPLFILCYNDTCSYTWTGNDHIHQDIFECRTCGLTGSLCCCTECAGTCHRNHECKLKKTSPTAYCDCWEKCSCSALVAGNEVQREHLFHEMLEHTNLISMPNSRGEHLLLFLARTVGRQLIEQDSFGRRSRKAPVTAAGAKEPPETNLDPPKFAQKAFKLCLGDAGAMKSLISIGLRKRAFLPTTHVTDDTFHLQNQSGSTHLDKFVFALLSKCQEAHLDILLNTLISAANKKSHFRDADIDQYIARFLRSVVRIFALVTLIAPSTLSFTVASAFSNASDVPAKFSTSANEAAPSTSSRFTAQRTLHSIAGVLSLVNAGRQIVDRSKEKKKSVNNFALRCRRIFQALPTYSIVELMGAGESYMGPVRNGFINPALNISRAMHTVDALEFIERYLAGEQDLASLWEPTGTSVVIARRRFGSRRDTDDEGVTAEAARNASVAESDDSDSDSDQEVAQNHGAPPVNRMSLHNHAGENMGQVLGVFRRGPVNNVVVEGSSSDEDSDSDNENDSDGLQAEVFDGADFHNDDFDDDDDIRENDEDDDEYYDDDDVDEGPNEFGDDVDGEGSGREDDFNEGEDVVASNGLADVTIHAEEAPGRGGESANENQAAANSAAVRAASDATFDVVFQNDTELASPLNETVDMNDDVAMAPSDREDNAGGFRSVHRGHSASRLRGHRNLAWAVNNPAAPVISRRDDGNANELVIRTNGGPSDPDAGNPRAVKSPSEEAHMSTEKTAFQFAATFAALLKVVDDLMLQMTQPVIADSHPGIPTVLRVDRPTLLALRTYIDTMLGPGWLWLTQTLDKVESQLKFGNAMTSSPLQHLLQWDSDREGKRAADERRKFKSRVAETPTAPKKDGHHCRRDFVQYFFAVARSGSNENGDELPIIENRALRTAAFVAEAYLFHASVLEVVDPRIKNYYNSVDSSRPQPHPTALREFFLRPGPICYPGISFVAPHNAFQYSADECLPLASRSALLQPDIDRSQLFGLPVPSRTLEEHLKLMTEHGVARPGYQSLSIGNAPLAEVVRKEGYLDLPATNVRRTYCPDKVKVIPEEYTVDEAYAVKTTVSRFALHRLISRWSNALTLITQLFAEDLVHYCGADANSSMILVEVGGFHFRLSQFRRRIEKPKSSALKELSFLGMVRDSYTLVVQTFRLLNMQYNRRVASLTPSISRVFSRSNNDANAGAASSSGTGAASASNSAGAAAAGSSNGNSGANNPPPTPAAPSHPPLASNKVKVMFKDEPGEGTGVARSFYAAVADVLISLDHMPYESFDQVDDGSDKKRSSISVAQPQAASSSAVDATINPPRRLTKEAFAALSSSAVSLRRTPRKSKPVFVADTEPYVSTTKNGTGEDNNKADVQKLFEKILSIEPVFAHRVTAMIARALPNEIATLLSTDDILKGHMVECIKLCQAAGFLNSHEKESEVPSRREHAPFFTRTKTVGHYVPVPGCTTDTRLNAFRNIGRMIGICLQQREIFPIQFARHVLKYFLGQKIDWFDLAFYDPELFESMRKLVDTSGQPHSEEFYHQAGLTFSYSFEDGEVLLKPNGDNISVTRDNILEFLYHFVQERLIGPSLPVLEAMRKGIFDVIPREALTNLTPDDLRLILCGNPEINITLLESFTKFQDESSSSPETLEKYKQTFWSIVHKFTDQEKQDLIFFWTGSPTLPATEEDFQPLPTVMIRPPDNLHLPTANTCISRLYIPLYSSKKTLRSKLLMAIKARTFGFV